MLTVRVTIKVKGNPIELTAVDEDVQTLAALIDACYQILPPSLEPAQEEQTATTNGVPVCPIHKQPMSPSKRGGWYCPERDPRSGKYCDYEFK